MTVGEKIQSIRKEKGLSQKDLAEKTGLSIATIQGYEQGKYKPKIENIQMICDKIEIPLRRLIQVDKNHLPYQLEEQKFKTIADHYGFKNQSMMMIEECSELQKAICKWHRERGDSLRSESSDCDERTAIIDELADVIIMAKQISYLLPAEDEVSEQIEFKLDRQLRRMEEESCKE